jgi:hypothetical protein
LAAGYHYFDILSSSDCWIKETTILISSDLVTVQ